MSKHFAMLCADALHSRKIDGLTLDAEAVYYRLHMATDKYGTMPGGLYDVMSRAFATRKGINASQVAAHLVELEAARLIERWVEDGDEWLAIVGFDGHTTAEYRRKRKRYYPVPPSQRPPDSDPVPTPFRDSAEPLLGDFSDPVPTLVEGRGGPSTSGAASGPFTHHLRHVPHGSSLVSHIGHTIVADREEKQRDDLALLRDSQGDLPTAAHLVSHAQGGDAA